MANMNLFLPLSEQTKKDVLVEFRAGRMNKDANSKTVRPDKRKGLVQLRLNSTDNLIHFIWKDRTTGTVETDLMLFPDDATFRKVEEAKSRVYVLEFKTSEKKLFFWMQEPKDDKDKENCENINKHIANPPQPGQSGSGGGANANAAGLLNSLGLGNIENLGALGGLDQQQLFQLLSQGGDIFGGGGAGAGGGSTSTAAPARSTASANKPPTSAPTIAVPAASSVPAASTAPSNQGRAQLNETLQNFFANLQVPQENKGPSLKDVVNVDEILESGLFENPEVVSKLAEFLPPGPVTAENLRENARSPQFAQAVGMFNQALRTGQLSGIMSSFGLDNSQVGPNATIEDFLLAIQKKAKEDKKDEKMDTTD